MRGGYRIFHLTYCVHGVHRGRTAVPHAVESSCTDLEAFVYCRTASMCNHKSILLSGYLAGYMDPGVPRQPAKGDLSHTWSESPYIHVLSKVMEDKLVALGGP
jgi:hypothetical protein